MSKNPIVIDSEGQEIEATHDGSVHSYNDWCNDCQGPCYFADLLEKHYEEKE